MQGPGTRGRTRGAGHVRRARSEAQRLNLPLRAPPPTASYGCYGCYDPQAFDQQGLVKHRESNMSKPLALIPGHIPYFNPARGCSTAGSNMSDSFVERQLDIELMGIKAGSKAGSFVLFTEPPG